MPGYDRGDAATSSHEHRPAAHAGSKSAAQRFAMVLLASVACGDPPTIHDDARQSTQATPASRTLGAQPDTYDETLKRIGIMIPGFGGAYPDAGRLVVIMKRGSPVGADVEATIRTTLRAVRSTNLLGRYSEAEYQFIEGDYAFHDLSNHLNNMLSDGVPKGTVFTGIDKRNNRVYVGVAGASARAEWASRAQRVDPIAEFITIQDVEPPRPMVGLRDHQRPIAGGAQIARVWEANGASSAGICSLGANVKRGADPGGRYFVTASHCTFKMWGLDPDSVRLRWYQPNVDSDSVASREALDPAPFSGGINCPSGKLCRWTDVTMVKYTDTTAWQQHVAIAGTTSPFNITAYMQYYEQPWYHEGWPWAQKTGRTTGTTAVTYPSLINYCFNFYPDSAVYKNQSGVTIGSNWALLCQNSSTSLTVGSGDSGAPVFANWGDGPVGYVYLDGIFHAGNSTIAIWSPASGIWFDMEWSITWYP